MFVKVHDSMSHIHWELQQLKKDTCNAATTYSPWQTDKVLMVYPCVLDNKRWVRLK